MKSRWSVHERFCKLYGIAADELGVDVDCICKSDNKEHEQSVMIDERPMDFLEACALRDLAMRRATRRMLKLFLWVMCVVSIHGLGFFAGWLIWG